jgi:hypothetical protein
MNRYQNNLTQWSAWPLRALVRGAIVEFTPRSGTLPGLVCLLQNQSSLFAARVVTGTVIGNTGLLLFSGYSSAG